MLTRAMHGLMGSTLDVSVFVCAAPSVKLAMKAKGSSIGGSFFCDSGCEAWRTGDDSS